MTTTLARDLTPGAVILRDTVTQGGGYVPAFVLATSKPYDIGRGFMVIAVARQLATRGGPIRVTEFGLDEEVTTVEDFPRNAGDPLLCPACDRTEPPTWTCRDAGAAEAVCRFCGWRITTVDGDTFTYMALSTFNGFGTSTRPPAPVRTGGSEDAVRVPARALTRGARVTLADAQGDYVAKVVAVTDEFSVDGGPALLGALVCVEGGTSTTYPMVIPADTMLPLADEGIAPTAVTCSTCGGTDVEWFARSEGSVAQACRSCGGERPLMSQGEEGTSDVT